MYSAELIFPSSHPDVLVKSITFDDNGAYSRSSISVSAEASSVKVLISAKDITALRAAINDVLRLVRAASSVESHLS